MVYIAFNKPVGIVCTTDQRREKNNIIDPYLINSIKGLRNLKQTYSLCVQTGARIDTIISKIERSIKIILENSLDDETSSDPDE